MSDCEYELMVLKPEDFEEVAVFLDKHYFTRDPICLGVHVVDAHVREGNLSKKVRQTLCSGVSIGARVKANGELAGIRLSVIKPSDECVEHLGPEVELIEIQEDVMKIFGMLWENVDEFGDEQKILEMFMLCVAEEHGKKGLATKLVKECIRLGKAVGCNRSVVAISNRYSLFLYKKLEFEIVKVLDLTKLGPNYKGPPLDIDNMNGNSSLYVMIKQGLPQTLQNV